MFQEELEFTADNFATDVNGDLLLKLAQFTDIPSTPSRIRNRVTPFKLNRAQTISENYTYTIPEGFHIDNTPEDIDKQSRFGSYTSHTEVKDNQLHFTRTYVTNKGTYDADSYSDFRSFRKKINQIEKQKIILKKTK